MSPVVKLAAFRWKSNIPTWGWHVLFPEGVWCGTSLTSSVIVSSVQNKLTQNKPQTHRPFCTHSLRPPKDRQLHKSLCSGWNHRPCSFWSWCCSSAGQSTNWESSYSCLLQQIIFCLMVNRAVLIGDVAALTCYSLTGVTGCHCLKCVCGVSFSERTDVSRTGSYGELQWWKLCASLVGNLGKHRCVGEEHALCAEVFQFWV